MVNVVTPTQVQDTTPIETVEAQLQVATDLLMKTEKLQNDLAAAERLYKKGQDVDLAQTQTAARRQFEDVKHMVKRFPGTQQEKTVDPVSSLQLVDDYWHHVGRRKDTMPTGLKTLNTMLGGGLEPQRLVVLLGAPGGGKTTLANQIAEHVAHGENEKPGRPVLYVTSEDSPFTLLAKTLSRTGDLDYNGVLKGFDGLRTEINEARKKYGESDSAKLLLYLDASMGLEMHRLKEIARAHFEQYKEHKQGVIVVDYLQRMARAIPSYRAGGMELRNAVTRLTEDLKSLSGELDCCVIALAAQNRASGYGAKDNAISSGKESGDIEYTADIIMAIGDDDRDQLSSFIKPKVLNVVKNRQGDTGQIILNWFGLRQKLTEVEITPDGDGPSSVSSSIPASMKKGR